MFFSSTEIAFTVSFYRNSTVPRSITGSKICGRQVRNRNRYWKLEEQAGIPEHVIASRQSKRKGKAGNKFIDIETITTFLQSLPRRRKRICCTALLIRLLLIFVVKLDCQGRSFFKCAARNRSYGFQNDLSLKSKGTLSDV